MTTAPATDARIRPLIQKASTGAHLTRAEIQTALETMISGEATPAQMGAFLMALRVRGETIEEITGAAELLRARMTPVTAPPGTIDIVGTGGDSHGTYNISTCTAIVAAGAGAQVAKHGNRSVSSKSGASDVLAALGVKLDISPETVSRCIETAGVGFMWAPMHHAAMKHFAPVRADLGIRTIFNVLGPLSNPARVTRQVIGVYARDLVEPIAHVLKNLGSEHALVVHGSDGMDELTTTGPSFVAELKSGEVTTYEVGPSDAGLPSAKLADLIGGDANVNAQAIRDLLDGKRGAYRDIVVLNAAAAMIVAGKAGDLAAGAKLAETAIDTGAAKNALAKLVETSNAG
ncbi:MAG: anthranilate phosphoribosyltransferase [Hyphomicrobiaceae bacterium]|nr:anthranilate phosphoribosyltransferase [Hyphomicrobiaceae bacterium]